MGKKKNSVNNSPCGNGGNIFSLSCDCSSPQLEPRRQSEGGCTISPPQPEPRRQNEVCECVISPPQPDPKQQSGPCQCTGKGPPNVNCKCGPPQLQRQPQPEQKQQPQPEQKQQSGTCPCGGIAPDPKSKRKTDASEYGSSAPQPQTAQPIVYCQCDRPELSEVTRYGGACACGNIAPDPQRITGASQYGAPQPQGTQPNFCCQCDRPGQSAATPYSGACACGSSAPNKSWQHSDAQPKVHCQCDHYCKSNNNETVPVAQTYVCSRSAPQPKPLLQCQCNQPDASPYPEPRQSYGLAAVQSPPKPVEVTCGHQSQVPLVTHGTHNQNQKPKPTKPEKKKKDVRFNR